MFDCGMVEKVRPVLIFSVPFTDSDRAVVTVVFHSTALRGSQFEVEVKVPFLKDGAFIAQSVATYPAFPRDPETGCSERNGSSQG
jgi:mRNA interferase MazF